MPPAFSCGLEGESFISLVAGLLLGETLTDLVQIIVVAELCVL